MILSQEQTSYIHQVEVLSFQPKPVYIQYQQNIGYHWKTFRPAIKPLNAELTTVNF